MNKKKGMSIAAVLGIMVCLASIVTTVFILAARSSILTSRSLKYIESYNEASSSIDNSVQFMVNEANMNGVTITGNFVHEKCDVMEVLFGVITSTTVSSGTTEIDMVKEGFVVEIKKEYYTSGSKIAYLRSVVQFSASMTGGAPQIITPDLAIDKEVEITDKSQVTQPKYNPANLLWNYWADQYDNTEDGDTTKNTLIKVLTEGNIYNVQGPLGQIMGNFKKLYPYLSDFDRIDGQIYIKLEGQMYKLDDALRKLGFNDLIGHISNFDTSSFIESCKNAFLDYSGSHGTWYNGLHESSFMNKFGRDTNADGVIDTLVINENVKIGDIRVNENNYSNIKNIYVTNKSLLYVNNGITMNCNLYIERGSTIFTGGSFEMDEYFESISADSKARVAPILDADYVSSSAVENADYIGGGLLVSGDFAYDATNSKGVLCSYSRYDYRSNSYKETNAYINGGFTVKGKTKIIYNHEDKESDKKISIGATIYSGNELSISNLAFAASPEKGVRPFLAFVESSITMKYCCSMVEGKPLLYNDNFDALSQYKNVGFGIITCTKVKDIKDVVGGKYLMMLNMFYNNSGEAQNDDDLLKVSQSWQKGAGAYGFNTFVSDKVLQKCTNDIERDSLYWYVPDKLRGSFVQAAISGTQSNSSKS